MSRRLLPLSEPVVTAMVARLNDSLGEYIDAVNAEVADGILIEHPVQIVDFVPSPAELVSFPTVAIVEGEGELEDDVGWGATGVFELGAIVFCQHADQQTLARQLRRYLRAVASCLLYGRSIGDAWGVTCRGFDPGPTLRRREEPRDWMSYAVVSLQARSEQDVE